MFFYSISHAFSVVLVKTINQDDNSRVLSKSVSQYSLSLIFGQYNCGNKYYISFFIIKLLSLKFYDYFTQQQKYFSQMMDNMRKNTNFFTNFRTCHCMKSVRIRSYSGPHFPAFGLNTKRYSVSLRIQSECGKMRTRIAPNRRFSYTGNWELVKSIVGTKLRRSYVCLHSQAGNRL